MKAAVFHETGSPLVIEDVADPIGGPSDLVIADLCNGDTDTVHAIAASRQRADTASEPAT